MKTVQLGGALLCTGGKAIFQLRVFINIIEFYEMSGLLFGKLFQLSVRMIVKKIYFHLLVTSFSFGVRNAIYKIRIYENNDSHDVIIVEIKIVVNEVSIPIQQLSKIQFLQPFLVSRHKNKKNQSHKISSFLPFFSRDISPLYYRSQVQLSKHLSTVDVKLFGKQVCCYVL